MTCGNINTDMQRFVANMETVDDVVNSSALTVTTPGGNTQTTLAGYDAEFDAAIASIGWIVVDSFSAGATLTTRNQALRYAATGELYRWDGALPKVVAPGSTPASSGGTGVGKWLLVTASSSLVDSLFAKSTLDLNFAANRHNVYGAFGPELTALTTAITTARNSTATYQSPTGIATAAINTPRIAYDAATGAPLGLLAEEARTNLLLNSQYTGASGETPPTGWVEGGTDTGVTTTTSSPRFTGAVRITVTGTVQRENIARIVTLAAATTYTFSAYFAAGTSADNTVMRVTTSDTPTGALTLAASDVTAAGVYSITFTTVAGGNYTFYIGLGCTGNATGTVIHETPQLEVGPAATSYIPTTTAQVTRVADVISRALPVTNANAGAIFIEFDLTSYDTSSPNATVVAKLCDLANTNNRGFGLNLSGNQFALRLRDSAINNSVSITVSNSLLLKKALISFDLTAGQMLIAIDGVSSGASVTTGIDLSLFVSHLFVHGGTAMTGSTIQHSKTVKRCAYFPRSFTAEEAQAITA